ANNHAVSSDNLSINFTDDEENVNPAKERSPSELIEASTSTTITTENGTQFKCELLCCTYYGRYVPEKQSDLNYGKVYCYYCRKAHQSGYHPQANKMSDYSFTVRGFNNWKNGLAKFEKHEKSVRHIDCVYLVQQQRKPPVVAPISSAHQHQQAQRRRMLLIQVKLIKFLLRQGLALRGHIEEEGNLIQLLKSKQDNVNELSSWINEGNYLSHDIINEICEIISLTIIRGQGFDSASTMSGHLFSVTARIKNLNSKAYYVHCNAHSLDLALQDLTRESPPMTSTLDITNEIVNFMKKSPKCLHLLDKLTESNYCPNLKLLCPTRWMVRASSMDSLVVNYDFVKISLDEISAEGHLVFCATEEVSCSLQRIDICLQDVLCAIKSLTKYLERIKCVDYFKRFYESILKEAESLTDEPVLPRIRKPPSKFVDTIRAPTVYQNPYEMFQQHYFDVVNKVLYALDFRFQQSVFPLLCKVEKFIIAAANRTKEDDNLNIESIVEFLNDDIDIPHLKCELNLLSDYFAAINWENNSGLKKISKIQTVCDLLNV
ncbi:unnamed protein product, partial [Rotaria sp. Silwood1]